MKEFTTDILAAIRTAICIAIVLTGAIAPIVAAIRIIWH